MLPLHARAATPCKMHARTQVIAERRLIQELGRLGLLAPTPAMAAATATAAPGQPAGAAAPVRLPPPLMQDP